MKAKQKARKLIPFNVMLTQVDRAHLDDLALLDSVSAGHVIRKLINAAHSMAIDQVPRCATGNPCFVPHMHSANVRHQNPEG